jgi:ATP-binding cassette subfamily C (CFTR/MRP) protein 1
MEDFLNGEELQKDARLVEPAVSADVSVDRQAEMVTIQNGEFRWLSTAPEPTLRDINLSIKKGELITVLGRVGDGKVRITLLPKYTILTNDLSFPMTLVQSAFIYL